MLSVNLHLHIALERLDEYMSKLIFVPKRRLHSLLTCTNNSPEQRGSNDNGSLVSDEQLAGLHPSCDNNEDNRKDDVMVRIFAE